MSAQFIIYALVDKQSEVPFYVGLSSSGLRRPKAHARDKYNARKHERMDLGYTTIVLEELDPQETALDQEPLDKKRNPWDASRQSNLGAAEIFWIAHLGRIDNGTGPLTNMSDGGRHNPSGEAYSEVQRKAWEDPEHRSKALVALKDSTSTPEAKAKHLSSTTKANGTPEFRAQRAASQAKLWEDPEYKEKQVATLRENGAKREASKRRTYQRRLGCTHEDADNCSCPTTRRRYLRLRKYDIL